MAVKLRLEKVWILSVTRRKIHYRLLFASDNTYSEYLGEVRWAFSIRHPSVDDNRNWFYLWKI